LITVLALYLFRREDTPLETSSLAVVAILSVMFAVFAFYSDGKYFEPSSLFFGFGQKALVTVCSLMIIGRGILRTGALGPGRYLAKLWKISPTLSLLPLLITHILAGGLS
jgi:hypothetical protein